MPQLTTCQEAIQTVQRTHRGAYDFEKFLDYDGTTAGWSFRTQGGDYSYVMVNGTVELNVSPYRWWAEDLAMKWLRR